MKLICEKIQKNLSKKHKIIQFSKNNGNKILTNFINDQNSLMLMKLLMKSKGFHHQQKRKRTYSKQFKRYIKINIKMPEKG